jgi:uncharacterized protein YdaT
MLHLQPLVREKAIVIANAVLARRYEEGKQVVSQACRRSDGRMNMAFSSSDRA